MFAVPSFSRLFSTSHLPDAFGLRSGALLLILRLSQPAAGQSAGLLSSAAHLLKIARNVSTVKYAAGAVANDIDDRLDTMPYEQIKTLGEVKSGSEPCAFVMNPEVVTPHDWEQFRKLGTAGLLSFPATAAFANVIAEKVVAERDACHLAQGNPQARLDAKQRHIELSALCVSFMGAVLNPAQGAEMTARADALTYDTIAAAMPDLVRYGEVLQIHDDLSDLLRDKREEEDLNVVTPNAVLADMAQGPAFDDLEDYFALRGDKLPVGQFTGIDRFPGAVRSAWKRSTEAAMDVASQVSDPRAAKCMHAMLSGLPGPLVPQAPQSIPA